MRTKYWFDLIHQQVFRYVGTGLPGLTGTKLGLMRLAQGHNAMTPVIGSKPRPLGIESNTLPLSHCAPRTKYWLTASSSLLRKGVVR